MILGMRTDAPEAHVVIVKNNGNVDDFEWHAHRTLARDLLKMIKERLESAQADWPDLKGIVLFEGPGSFTGLRIGGTVANTIAHAQKIPIVGTRGESWLQEGVKKLQENMDDKFVLPFYGAEANITKPRK